MRSIVKVTVSFLLIILFLVSCFALFTLGYFAAWLQTYRAFTERRPVAEVIISEMKTDTLGSYTEVEFTEIDTDSALSKALAINSSNSEIHKATQKYKLYGDVVYIGGPIVKFHDSLILINFKTTYKLGKIFARYDLNNELEKNRTPAMASTYDIDGGYGDWKVIHDNLSSGTLVGKLYGLFIDTTQISAPGIYISNRPLKYTLYITTTGFLWKLEDNQ